MVDDEDISHRYVKTKLIYRIDAEEPFLDSKRTLVAAWMSREFRRLPATFKVNNRGDARSIVVVATFARVADAASFLSANESIDAAGVELQGSYFILPGERAHVIEALGGHVCRLSSLPACHTTRAVREEMRRFGPIYNFMYHRGDKSNAYVTFCREQSAVAAAKAGRITIVSEAGARATIPITRPASKMVSTRSLNSQLELDDSPSSPNGRDDGDVQDIDHALRDLDDAIVGMLDRLQRAVAELQQPSVVVDDHVGRMLLGRDVFAAIS